VQRLVERAAARSEPLGEHVDRHLVQRQRHEHAALVRCQDLVGGLPERRQHLRLLDRGVRPCVAGNRLPSLGLDRDLAAQPAALAHRDAGLVEGELPRPGREPALAAVVVQAFENGHERVVGRLGREVVEALAPGLPRPAREREPRGPEQELVQLRQRAVPFDAARAQPRQPGPRVGIRPPVRRPCPIRVSSRDRG
jgi:hypothetical protein